MKYRTIMLNDGCLLHCRNLSQHFKKLSKSVSVKESNLKFCTVTSYKNTYQIPKNQISIAETLISPCTLFIQSLIVKK